MVIPFKILNPSTAFAQKIYISANTNLNKLYILKYMQNIILSLIQYVFLTVFKADYFISYSMMKLQAAKRDFKMVWTLDNTFKIEKD